MTRSIAYMGLLLVLAVLAGCPLGTTLVVSPLALSFSGTSDRNSFTIRNGGTGVLAWHVAESPDWATVEPLSGSVTVGADVVAVTINRSLLNSGTSSSRIKITSNGGVRYVGVSATIVPPPVPPALSVTPTALAFGATDLVKTLTIANSGEGTVTWHIAESIPWLTVSPTAGSVPTTTGAVTMRTATVTVTVSRLGLAPGDYSGDLAITSNGGNATIPVNMSVPVPMGQPTVAPTSLSFGPMDRSRNVTLRNVGDAVLGWSAGMTVPWAAATPSMGDLDPGAEVAIRITVDRTGLAPGEYAGILHLDGDGNPARVSVDMTMTVAAPQLVVAPEILNFGSNTNNKLITVTNPGMQPVNWSVDTAAFPAWLSLSPTSGSVVNSTQGVLVTVNRAPGGARLSPGSYSHELEVTSNAGTDRVTVNMTVADVPVLIVDTGNPENSHLLAIGEVAITGPFTISNGGTGSLNWSIDPTALPSWLLVSPVAGAVTVGLNTVTVTVNRRGLQPGGYIHDLRVTSNGGSATVTITMQVPLQPVIGVDPAEVNLGLRTETGSFWVANVGSAGTILNYRVVSNRTWLYCSPATGTSVGVVGPLKDWQRVNISVDRGGLGGIGGAGKFTVYALDRTGAINPDITPQEVMVSVEAAALSFESAIARKRIPSMVRFVFNMRDVFDRAFLVAPEDLADAFTVFEKGIALEYPSETTQVLFAQNSDLSSPLTQQRDDLRTKVILLLDYSGSMYSAANRAGQSIQDVYEEVGGAFADDFFGHFPDAERGFVQMAVMEFHDRNVPARLVTLPGEPDFVDNAAAVRQRIESIRIADHGASAILPSLLIAGSVFLGEDFPHIPFDDADIRAAVVFTDGRLTTPPGEVSDVVDILLAEKTRVFAVGWGIEVNSDPLARLSSLTGGHYYPTHPDSDGNPVVERFAEKAETVAHDLASHMVLNYVTLSEEEGVPVRFDAAFDRPDDSPDQGLLQGSLEEQTLDLLAIAGDISMGQISMRTPGVEGGSTTVVLRAEYIPRNINRFEFTLSSPETFSVAVVPEVEGGLVEGWTLAGAAGTYTLTASGGAVLDYGSFGDLVRLTFPGVTNTPFVLALTVNNDLYAADPEPKYFVYPDTITIDSTPFLAPAFPTPQVEPLFIDFGSFLNEAEVEIRNIGGSYPYGLPYGQASVLLYWKVLQEPPFVTVTPKWGARSTTVGADIMRVTMRRDLDPGNYGGYVILEYTGGDLAIGGTIYIYVQGAIGPPVLSVTPQTLAFGDTQNSRTFSITNTGQATLLWTVDRSALPPWIASATPETGSAASGETDVVTVNVDRSVAPGDYSYGLRVTSRDNSGVYMDSRTVTVTITVTPPALAVDTNVLDFADTVNTLPLVVSNTGQGILSWSIENLPAWLRVDQASGSIGYASNVRVNVTADRSVLPGWYSGTFDVVGRNGAAIVGTETVTVNLVVRPPVLELSPTALDFGDARIQMTFDVRNTGQSTLNWSIAPGWPVWIVSVNPSSGSIAGAGSRTVTVVITRTGSPPGVHTYDMLVGSNGGNGTVGLTMTVP